MEGPECAYVKHLFVQPAFPVCLPPLGCGCSCKHEVRSHLTWAIISNARGRRIRPRSSWLLGRVWFAEIRVSGVLEFRRIYLHSVMKFDRRHGEFLVMATLRSNPPKTLHAWLAAKEPSQFRGAKSSCCLRLSGFAAASRYDELLRFLLRIAFAASISMQDFIFKCY